MRCGTGRPAGRARGGGALQGRECHPVRQPQAVRTGILVRGTVCIRPPPGGWRQGQGAPDYVRGREGRMRCGTGRPAGRARGGSALQGRECHPVRQPQAVRTGILVRGTLHSPARGGAGGKGRAHPTMCGAERGACGVERAGPLQASAAGALYRAGGPPLLFPSDPGFLDSYVPTALHLRPPPPGAGGEGGGGPGCVRGRVGRRRGEGV